MPANLKDFDAKRFLLEKGERVGLGIAVTLMVVMILFSLFMPSKGFFSGSPGGKAQPLVDGAQQLQTALNTAQPGEADKPGDPKDKLIALNTKKLEAGPYEVFVVFTPNASDNPARRPPEILSLDEAVVKYASVPVDTFIFNRDYTQIWVLVDKDKDGASPAGPRNPYSQFSKQYGRPGMRLPAAPGGERGQSGQLSRLPGQFLAAEEKPEYETKLVSLKQLESGSYRPARQLRPLRIAIIAGSFPFKAQVEEFQKKLRLSSIPEVFNEVVQDDKQALPAFRFLGVNVERREVDADGKPLTEWAKLDLAASYKPWLLSSGRPFQPEDPKYAAISFPGLVMPRLREFHPEEQNLEAMMGAPMIPGARPERAEGPKEAAVKPPDSKYPDVESGLASIQATLEALEKDNAIQQIAAPSSKFRTDNFDPFDPNPTGSTGEMMAPGDVANPGGVRPESAPAGGAQQVGTIPEHCLVRLVDVDIQPGKFYRYRLQVRMANPNYNRMDVASPGYKLDKELKSDKWFEVKQTVSVPPELTYYVVDQMEKDGKAYGKGMNYNKNPARNQQVVFQLHRWIDAAAVDQGSKDLIPIGDWAVADRVFVTRGEPVGQTAKIELPVWRYTQNSFVIPATADQKSVRGKRNGGANISFGHDNKEGNQTILVDFEGGRRTYETVVATAEGGTVKGPAVNDMSAIEVLMISPEGKLLARNSADDASDEERIKRRDDFRQRIQQVKDGKSGGASPGSGLDAPRSGGRGN